MRYIIFDLEATCWPNSKIEEMEIIELGALKIDSNDFSLISEFQSFVLPIVNPKLSDFCIELTKIRQQDIDRAKMFPNVLENFISWIGMSSFKLCSWGDYDLRQLRVDCRRHSLIFPKRFRKHVNLKQAFSNNKKCRPCGMEAALKISGLPLVGTHHRAIDDARNIASLARLIL